MADIDDKAQALSAAKDAIIRLQEQMTDRILKMAVQVEKLLDIVPASEAKAFLKARCNLPAVELSTYVKFAQTLKGSDDVLRKARVSFPVVKALVSSDAATRQEILERMDIGAQIDTKDVTAIRKRLAAAKLTIWETTIAHNRKMVAAAARKQTKMAVSSLEKKMAAFVEEIRIHFRKGQADAAIQAALRQEAGLLRGDLEALFGGDHPALRALRPASAQYRIAHAHKVLDGLATGKIFEVGPMEISTLRAFSGTSRVAFDPRPRKPLSKLPGLTWRPRVLELCAGAGGLALGLERAGFEHVALVEWDKHAAATLRANRPKWDVIEEDVRHVDFTQYRNERIDLLTGGLPCTPFSTVGEKKGRDDPNDLLMEGVKAVEAVMPKAFFFEQVEGFLHSRHADYVAALLRRLSKAGYRTEINRINARDFGAAQDRSRIMLVGIRKDVPSVFRMPPKFPEKRANMGDVLHDLMSELGWSGADDWAQMMRTRPEFDRFGNPLGLGALSDTIRAYQGSPQAGEARRAQKNGVSYAPPARTAPTDADTSKEGFVPGLTAQMRARLQGFPDDWTFVGSRGSVVDQIGNAVVPAVAQAMGLALLSTLQGWEIDWDAMMSTGQTDGRKQILPPSMDLSIGALELQSDHAFEPQA
ncbi:DNA cytosine methyltransferase [Neorhizobium galegae]|uniref:DNA cytosine methyltransferase n=1 Tax=Neorhizobium galegae TaxID=399 RepID=UPI0021013147|nr:DNA (cytosine-5-)-methyltransferase [Neorhizobium galegae]MCQ1572725.1 DNA cytosine methyltransferase [Neorhizobium galegae]